MNETKFFLHEIRENVDGTIGKKGIEEHAEFESAKQSYHAFMAAYAYGRDPNTRFVSCMITNKSGMILEPFKETWNAPEVEPQE